MANRNDIFSYAKKLYADDNLGEAAGVLTALIALNPQDYESLQQLAHIRREQGDYARAMTLFTRITQHPSNKTSGTAGMALTLFQMEQFEKAWQAFDIRFSMMDNPPVVTVTRNGKAVNLPKWDGTTEIKNLLVMAEQGLGDTLQFAQYIPHAVKRGIKVVVVAPKRLHALLKTLPATFELRPLEEKGSVNVSHWIPMMGLPHALKLNASHYASPKPYFSIDAARKQAWQDKIGTHGIKVGLIWQGNPDPSIDTGRSIPLELFKPLLDIPHLRLISLQKGFGEEQITTSSFRNRIEIMEHVDEGEDGFLDTAAIMQNMDVVVSSCTSATHLAGALQVKTKLLLKKFGTDWRWLARPKSTIWYPAHTLYRQHKNGDWAAAIADIVKDIRDEVASPTLSPEIQPFKAFSPA